VIDYDSRLVDLYDEDNPDGPDHDFYRALADERHAKLVLDLGCGTGILTATLVRDDRTVVGVDPSAGMVTYARRRPGASSVTWILGDSGSIPGVQFDYTVMTGNVVQHILGTDWDRTLRDIRSSLVAGGTLAFESRNPAARAWEEWGSSPRTTRETPGGALAEWADVRELGDGVVEIAFHNLFVEANETVTETLCLAFRERNLLEDQLRDAGFDVEAVYGDWQRTPFTAQSPLMVFVARAR
jgi:SAM-dependent methyltransferase